MFSLIASMLSTSQHSDHTVHAFNKSNADAKSGTSAYFLSGADAVDNSSRLYTDWLFGEIDLPDNQPSACCQCCCN